MRSKIHFKAGICYSHYECYGHTSRAMAVGEVFKKRFPQGDLFFIQAGVQQPKATIDQLGRMYSLPMAFMDRRNFREPVRGDAADVPKRACVCADIVSRERPDLFITEFFPLGREECRHELIPSLVKASNQGAVLWAVAGYPLLTGTDYGWRRKILGLYQRIIIFSPSLEKKLIADSLPCADAKKEYLDFFERYASKIIFAGYLLPQQEVVKIPSPFVGRVREGEINLSQLSISKGACRVAVLRGGGAYFPKVIAQAIRASDRLGKEYYLTVVAGPSTTSEEWDFFSTLVAKKRVNNLVLLRSVSNYEGLIEESDVCVSVAAYHTSVMLLKHRKKAVVIPFEGYGEMSFHEQPARAVILKELIGAKILSIQDLTVNTLVAAVKDAAYSQRVRSHIPKEWFMGGDVLDKALIGLFGR